MATPSSSESNTFGKDSNPWPTTMLDPSPWSMAALSRDLMRNLDNDDDDDFEVSRAAIARPTSFDRSVGSRNTSSRSTSGSSGSVSFSDDFKSSPPLSSLSIIPNSDATQFGAISNGSRDTTATSDSPGAGSTPPISRTPIEESLLANMKSLSVLDEPPRLSTRSASPPEVAREPSAAILRQQIGNVTGPVEMCDTFMANIAALARLNEIQQAQQQAQQRYTHQSLASQLPGLPRQHFDGYGISPAVATPNYGYYNNYGGRAAAAHGMGMMGDPYYNNAYNPYYQVQATTTQRMMMNMAVGSAAGPSQRIESKMAAANTVDGGQMQIRCKFGRAGCNPGQFNMPHGFCTGLREEIVVADTQNHRVQIFDKNGNFLNEFGSAGKEEGFLWYPRKVAVMKHTGNFVVCDRGSERSRMQIFSPTGRFIRRINIRFIDIVAGLAITKDNHIAAIDSVTPTVFVIAENGDLVTYFDCKDFMSEPSDIAVFGSDFYICDFKAHCVVVIDEHGRFLRRIGSDQVTSFPNGIDISDMGDVLVGDSHGNQFHVAIYDCRGDLISQYQCPQVKVSRCCGLKITSEGYIITLAKNNNHVLVLNTLFVP